MALANDSPRDLVGCHWHGAGEYHLPAKNVDWKAGEIVGVNMSTGIAEPLAAGVLAVGVVPENAGRDLTGVSNGAERIMAQARPVKLPQTTSQFAVDAAPGLPVFWDASANKCVNTSNSGANAYVGDLIRASSTTVVHVDIRLSNSLRYALESQTDAIDQYIGAPVADAAALQAIAAANRFNGQIRVKLDDDTIWTFDSGSSASTSDWVIVPSAGTGRWLRNHVSLTDLVTLDVPAMQAVNATLASGTITISTGITVAANSEVIPLLIGALTGTTNFGSLGELKASRVNGAPGVGTVVIQAYGDDGALDADAAGAIRVVILTPQS